MDCTEDMNFLEVVCGHQVAVGGEMNRNYGTSSADFLSKPELRKELGSTPTEHKRAGMFYIGGHFQDLSEEMEGVMF